MKKKSVQSKGKTNRQVTDRKTSVSSHRARPMSHDRTAAKAARSNLRELAREFARYFANWKISLPRRAVAEREEGYLTKAGWLIQYCFGADRKGEFLDFYAAHRMTDDRHLRIWEDGSTKRLPAIEMFRACSDDPVEDARLAKQFFRANQKVSRQLIKKGFARETLNMSLCTTPQKDPQT